MKPIKPKPKVTKITIQTYDMSYLHHNNEENNKEISNVSYSKDVMEGQLGPLVGVLSSMEWILSNRKNYQWVMTFPCDTPFFNEDIVDQIKQKQSQSDKKLFFLKSGEKRHNIFGMWSVDL